MATKIITIRKQATNTDLYLTDSEGNAGNTITTKAKPGDTIVWELDPNGGIDQITDIIKRDISGNVNVFNPLPAPIDPKDPKSAWKGKISQSAIGAEIYDIHYMIKGVGFIGDPIIDVDEEDNDELSSAN